MTISNLPQEVANEISDTPSLSGTTDVLITNLKPMILFGRNIADIPKARSYIPQMIQKMADIINIGGYTGWECIGVSILETADDKVILVVFLMEL